MVSERCAITGSEATRTLELVTGLIFEQLAKGNSVSLRGFGTFQVRKAKSKLGRNPSNPKQLKVIPERWNVRFRPGGAMKVALSSLPIDDPSIP